MKLQDISKEELESMNFDDIAYIILNEEKEKMKINILFRKVCDALELSEGEYEAKIADFFEQLTTDKRFLMLEDGSWDLKERHNTKVIIDDDDEDDETDLIEEESEDTDSNSEGDNDIFYDSDTDDDLPDDELEDLVVIDVDEEEANN